MKHLQFSWDPRKAEVNFRKHQVSFPEAVSVFSDDMAKLIPDPDHSDVEDRFILLGFSVNLRCLVVCHAYRRGGGFLGWIAAGLGLGSFRKL